MYLGLDLGTSGVKALLIDGDQQVMAVGHGALEVQRPHPLWSEQDPLAWVAAGEVALAQIRQQAPRAFADLRAISLSGQMHGATLIDARDRPLRPAILWNDGRAHRQCAELEERADFRGLAGNIVMAGFTAPKLRWVQQHEPQVFDAIHKVLLPKDFLRLWLTGDYISDMSDAAGTAWLDVARRDWADPLLAATNLSRDHMPNLAEGSARAGTLRPALAKAWGLDAARTSGSVLVAGGAGDNAATACGLGVVSPGDGFLSLGTSGVLFSVTDQMAVNTDRALHSFCHALPGTWHQMGVILSATDSLAWLGEITGQSPAALAALLPPTPQDLLATSGLTFLPYLSGERTPHNAPWATGGFHGLRRGHAIADLAQAVMEGVGFAFADCAQALKSCGALPESVWVAGGGSQSDAWLHLIAAITGLPLHVPAHGEQGAALGAARLALMAHHGAQTPGEAGTILSPPARTTIITPRADLADAYARKYQTYQALWAQNKALMHGHTG